MQFGALAGLVSLLGVGCASLPRARAPSEGEGLRYEVAVPGDASVLVVEAAVPAGLPPYFGMARGAVPFVRELHVTTDGERWSRVAATDTFFFIPECAPRGCRLRYQFALETAARTLRDVDRARVLAPSVFEAPPSTWLLRPIGHASGPYTLHVMPTAGVRFVTGLFPLEEDTWTGDVGQLGLSPYTVLGRFGVELVRPDQHGAAIQVVVPRTLEASRAVLREWVERSARVVANYYERFPVRHALVILAPRPGAGVRHGRTLGNGGAATIVWVGEDTSAEDLERDWVLPHELVHMALPSVDESHRWFEEGVATYVEKVARVSAGEVAEEAFWGELLEGLPKGLPHQGDRGLDHTPTWGRRYWGGALFCFLADVEIRRRTEGRASLADALRGIVKSGGSVAVSWDFRRALAAGDAAVGVPVLRELHDRMGERPMPVDLGALWSRLGVSLADGRVVLDDGAPASAFRRSLIPRDE